MIDALIAIAANGYKVGENEAGFRACERVLSLPDLDPDDEQRVRTWRTEYAKRLVPFGEVRLDVPTREGWSLFNPTILAHGEGFLAIVRSSNYRIVEGRYVIPDEDGDRIRTENILVELGNDLTVLRSRVIVDPDYETNGFPVDGLEDCRLRPTRSGVGVSATVRNVAPFDGRCRIATAELDLDAPRFHSLRVIESAAAQEHEKNWMPLIGKAAWLYQCSYQGHVVTVQEHAELPDEYCLLQHDSAHPLARGFRGGSQLVPFRDGWLGCVHEVAWRNGLRVYEHRFVWFTASLQLARVSMPFAFRENHAIEFCAGLAVKDGFVVASFGVRDAEAWLARFKEDELWDTLRVLPRCG